jgi:hypothetical protein
MSLINMNKEFTSIKDNFKISVEIDRINKISYLKIIKFGSEPIELSLLLNDIIYYLKELSINKVVQQVVMSDYEISIKENKYFTKIGEDKDREICEICCDTNNLGVGILSSLGFDLIS